MKKVTNKGAGVLVLNATVDGKPKQVSLAPGETKEIDLIENKATAARIEKGTLAVGAKAAAAAKEDDKK